MSKRSSYSMPRVFSEVFRSIDHESFASEKIDPMRHTLRIDVFTGALLEILTLLETQTLLHTCLVHLARFLT